MNVKMNRLLKYCLGVAAVVAVLVMVTYDKTISVGPEEIRPETAVNTFKLQNVPQQMEQNLLHDEEHMTHIVLPERRVLTQNVPPRSVSKPPPNPKRIVGIGRRSAFVEPMKRSTMPRTNNAIDRVKLNLLQDLTGLTYDKLLSAVMAGQAAGPALTPPVKIAIITTWRSGSTFLEQLLGSHPAVFDVYEPLLMYKMRRVRNGTDATRAQEIINNILHCRYYDDSYLAAMKKVKDMMERNVYIHKFCKIGTNDLSVCYDLDFLSSTCEIIPYTLMKLVRMRLALMEPFLKDPEIGDKLKLLYLVRDPRAVINSRRSTVGWCSSTSPDCYSPEVLCSDMMDDLLNAQRLQQLYPGKVHILRYEDMGSDPINQTQKILQAVGLDYHENIESFLRQHTTTEVDKPWSTSRDTKKRLMYWTTKMPWEDVDEVQQACAATMEAHGYKTINSLYSLSLEDVLLPLEGSL